MEFLWLLGVILAIVLMVEFFHIGYLVARLRDNSRVISTQLDQLLVASGVPDPGKARQEIRAKEVAKTRYE